jgi:rSAM/selenodomain-associated transferase 2
VIIAARNEAGRLPSLLADLAMAPDLIRDVVVSDGGSSDGTAQLATLAGAEVISVSPCRGRQLAAGVGASLGSWLLLLHADVRLPAQWAAAIRRGIDRGPATASAFRLAIEGNDPALRGVEWAVFLRTWLGQLPYGDQGLLLSRQLYERAGGIAPLPLMEDLEFVLRLRSVARIGCLPRALRVDGRRWACLGVWQTVWANARLRQRWRLGEDPESLAGSYYLLPERPSARVPRSR